MSHPSATTNRIVTAGLVVTLVIVAVQITTHLVDTGVYQLRVNALDSGLDSSIFGVVSACALAGAAACGLVAFAVTRRGVYGTLGVALALLLVANATDLRARPHGTLLVAPILVVILVGLVVAAQTAPGRARGALRAAAALLVVSFVLHVLVPVVFRRIGVADGSWPFEVKVAFKLATELAGFMLAGVGLAAVAYDAQRRDDAPTRRLVDNA
jgi:hypothetical protein